MPNPHKLTRDQMEALVKSGQGIVYNGNVINTIEGLPSEAELAKGDAEAEAALKAKLDQQAADVKAQQQALAESKADSGKNVDEEPAPKK